MGYTNSPLVSYTKIAPRSNGYGARTEKICFFTPHVFVGQVTVERIGSCFADPKRKASCNYGISYDGRVALIVEEKDAAGTSNSRWNDERAITLEIASDSKHPYALTTKAYNTLIDLLVDCCKRNGKTKVVWLGSKDKTMNYKPKDNEMVLTAHRWYAAKACPGDWLYSRLGDLASRANARLSGDPTPAPTPTPTTEMYRVRKSWDKPDTQVGAFGDLDNAKKCCDKYPGYSVFNKEGKAVYSSAQPQPTPAPTSGFKVKVNYTDLNIRKGAGTQYAVVGRTGKGTFTIVETAAGKGSNSGWGKLKSGKGWIALDYCVRL